MLAIEEHALQVQYNGWQDRKTNFYWYTVWPETRAKPRLLGALCKTVSTGGGGFEWLRKNERNAFVHVSLRPESCSRNSMSSAARYAFNLFFFVSSKRLYDSHVTWFDRFLHKKRRQHHIAINYHSCFHSRWPNSNIFESKGPPGVSGALCSLRILRIGIIWNI